MWSYGGKGLFFIGLALSLMIFLFFTVFSLTESSLATLQTVLTTLLPGDLIISDPQAPLPHDIITGDSGSPGKPLGNQTVVENLLGDLPAIRRIIPFSAAKIRIRSDLPDLTPQKSMLALAMEETDIRTLAPGLEINQTGEPSTTGTFWYLTAQDSRLLAESMAMTNRLTVNFIEAENSDDYTNLTQATVSGRLFLRNEAGSQNFFPVCLLDRVTFTKATWQGYEDFLPGTAATAPVLSEAAVPASFSLTRLAPAEPLSYPFLFSLPAGDDPFAAGQPAAAQYLLISREATTNRAELLSTVNKLFDHDGIKAIARPWDPASITPGWFGTLLVTFAVAALLLLVAANFLLIPSPSTTLLDNLEKGVPLVIRRSVFIKKNFFLTLVFGAIGLISATLLVVFFGVFSGPPEREFVSSVLRLPVQTVAPSFPAGVMSILYLMCFTVCTTIGPRRRLRRFIRRVPAP